MTQVRLIELEYAKENPFVPYGWTSSLVKPIIEFEEIEAEDLTISASAYDMQFYDSLDY